MMFLDMGSTIWIAAILVYLMIATSTWMVGLWNNLITLVILILSATIACGFCMQMSDSLTQGNRELMYQAPFVSIWGLFVISYVLLRIGTEILSPHRMIFDPITELVGRTVCSLIIAGVFMSFALFTLHMAALPNNGPFADSFLKIDNFDSANPTASAAPSAFGMGLDRLWGNFAHFESQGSLAESPMMARWLVVSEKLYTNGQGEYFRMVPGAKNADPTYVSASPKNIQGLTSFPKFEQIVAMGVLLREKYEAHSDAPKPK